MRVLCIYRTLLAPQDSLPIIAYFYEGGSVKVDGSG